MFSNAEIQVADGRRPILDRDMLDCTVCQCGRKNNLF
jgi:hypothetical protein